MKEPPGDKLMFQTQGTQGQEGKCNRIGDVPATGEGPRPAVILRARSRTDREGQLNVERFAQGDVSDDHQTKVAWSITWKASRRMRSRRSARRIVLALGGWQKHGMVRGASRLLKPHVLVTDELIAEHLVANTKP